MTAAAMTGASIDLYQTATEIVPHCAEMNPLIGRCGTGVPAPIVLPLTAMASLALAVALPPKWRRYWLGAWVGLEGVTVWNNYRAGY